MTDRGSKPIIRIHASMKRLSRDKWLSPEEVMEISTRLSKLCSTSYGNIVKHAFPYECFIVGMIKGEPPAYLFENRYKAVLEAVKKVEHSKTLTPEIELLKAMR